LNLQSGLEGAVQEETGRRESILAAAFEEFASKGFRGATIKSIAEAAGIQSPALLYWYFKSKEELFQAVLGEFTPLFRLLVDPAALRDRPPEEVLLRLARAYLATAEHPRAVRLIRLLAPEVIRRPDVADLLVKQGLNRILVFLKEYLAHQVALGRLRPHDTRSSARAFIGMILPQVATKVILPALGEDGLTDDEHVATIIGIFLRGLDAGEATEDRPPDDDVTESTGR
jgi:TetR/AcrR family transcriptional regulator